MGLADELLGAPDWEPHEVFTPRATPTREMFARRNQEDPLQRGKLQEVLEDALIEQGAQVVIFGDTGVGKTSLLKYVAEDQNFGLLTINCNSNDTFDTLLEKCIRGLIDSKEIRYSSERSLSGSGGISGEGKSRVFPLITFRGSAKADIGISRGQKTEVEVVDETPIEAIKTAMVAAGVDILSFDNFQNVSKAEDRRLVSEMMEHFSDAASTSGNLKIAVIGIADDIESLIFDSGSFRRRVCEVEVPRMPDNEIRSVLESGFTLLGLQADAAVLDKLVFYSDGFPFFAHLLGLSIGRTVRRRDEYDALNAEVADGDLETAIRSAITSVSQSYEPHYKAAVEASGKTRPRSTILDVLANSTQREWSGPQIISAWQEVNGDRTGYEFLYTALGQLSGEKYGQVLRRKGARTNYTYRFSDPYMRPYIRLLNGSIL